MQPEKKEKKKREREKNPVAHLQLLHWRLADDQIKSGLILPNKHTPRLVTLLLAFSDRVKDAIQCT